MAKRDYYDVLGVEKSAGPDQIKAAYRKQAVKYHPDKNKGDKGAEEKFKEASEAYHVLSNSERKQNYDNFGHAAFENGGGGGRGGFGNFDFSGSFSDIFEDFFGEGFGGGGRRSRRSNNRGSDLRYDLSISLEEAYAGKNKILSSQLLINVMFVTDQVQNQVIVQALVQCVEDMDKFAQARGSLLYNKLALSVQVLVNK